MPTICADCDHLLLENKTDPPWRWLCIRHPRLQGYGYVTKDTWVNAPPYLFCKDMNGGACPLYEPRRETTDPSKRSMVCPT